MAQLVKMPLENVYPLDEEVLLKEMGYAIVDLPLLQKLMIPYGGLADAGVSVGDTVIIAPATGGFGGAAVLTALSMGAKVVACGRNQRALEKLMIAMKNVSDGRLKSVAWTEDKDKDANLLKAAVGGRGADVYIDFSPPAAGAGGKTPAHMLQSISALKNGGTCVLMGGLTGSVTLPHMLLMINNITVRGKFMYERSQALQVIKMAEAGVLKLGSRVGYEIAQTFGLDNMDEALQEAEKLPGWGQSIAVVP
jgi:D-arabinose 1-dehydrogenase-like Zn-dependent alcohol dehydrogenase